MFYVYILQSLIDPQKTYIGYTADLTQRFNDHNAGKSIYTVRFKPWKMASFIAIESQEKAIALEKYLKTNAGKKFLKNRLV